MGLVCEFCGLRPATCVGASNNPGDILTGCDGCCGHTASLDDGGPCVRVPAGATLLDWPALAQAVVEVSP